MGLTAKRSRKAALRLAFSLLALTVVLLVVEPAKVLDSVRSVTLPAWLEALAGFALLHLLSAQKWRATVSLCGLAMTRAFAARAYGLGLFANLCLPSLVGGDLLRAGLAIRRHGRKEAVLLGAVCDRLADLAALGLLTGLGFVMAPRAVAAMDDVSTLERNILVGLAAAVVGVAIALPLVLSRLHPRRLPRRVGRFYVGFIRAFRTLRGAPLRAAIIFAFCFVLQAGFVLVNIRLGSAMGIELDWRLWFLLWPLAKIAAMAPVSLGGIGVREAAFAALAGRFVAEDLVVAQSLVWESILVAGGLLAGGIYLATGARPGEETG